MSELEATARNLLALAERKQPTDTKDALVLAASAASVARASGVHELEIAAERVAARSAYTLGDLASAERSYRRASSAARLLGDHLGAARSEASLAFVAYDRGEAGAAHEALDAVGAVLDTFAPGDLGALRLRALVAGYRGNLARQAGALEDARGHYERSLELADASDASMPRATFAMDLGATELAAGHRVEAALWLSRSERALEIGGASSAQALLAPLIAHYRALLLLSSEGAAQDAGALVDIGGPPALLPIRRWLFDATRGGTGRVGLDVALRKRLARLREVDIPLEHARFGAELLGRLAGEGQAADVVVVARDGSLIARLGVTADLGGREPLRRILEALALTALDGDPLALPQLVRIGWPSERIRPEAAKNRAHVALSTLRSLGLGPTLMHTPAGYVLDRSRVRIAS